MSFFDTVVEFTLNGYMKADGSSLSAIEIQAFSDFLSNLGLNSRFAVEIQRHAAKLADDAVYVT